MKSNQHHQHASNTAGGGTSGHNTAGVSSGSASHAHKGPSSGGNGHEHGGTAGYRNSRTNPHEVEVPSHVGQRSKSTSHSHHHHHNNAHQNHRDEGAHPSAQADSSGFHSGERTAGSAAHQPSVRAHSHAKGNSSGAPSGAQRDSHQHHGGASTSNGTKPSAATTSGGTGSNANAVGHYILGKALGEGTFGKVKLGTHVLTGEKVAVKVLEKSKIKDKKDVERISREIKILKQLHHPNVVQIYEIIETDKDLYLVMEFANGGELFELIVQNQKLKERTASKHLQELLAGVHYIHQLGICHRDLKPENLLLDFDGQLKIVDFGLSNMYEKGQTLKTACGSPCYAAPEMIAGNRYHGLKSDIWSCGVVLYAMLCGYLPFEDQKTSNLYKKIMNAEYSLPKFLSSEAKDILSKIFVTDPNKRIDIEGLKRHPWYRLHSPQNQNYDYHTRVRSTNEKLVAKMEATLGFSTESVQRAVENNKHNHLSATYYLLLKKYAQASYKANQSQRNTSVPARVDTRNPDYTSSHNHHKRQQSQKPTAQHSDTKNRSSIDHDAQKSSSNTASVTASAAAAKYGKFRNKGIEGDRLKAPVQDQLVLKNHRREQSANATAGRRQDRYGDWGSVEDERRTESYGRPAPPTDDYEIVISKVNKTREETKDPRGATSSEAPAFNQNLRSHFASPSPEAGPSGTRHRHGSNVTGHQAASKGSSDPKTKPVEVNISNVKQSSYNQVSTPSQHHSRAASVPKQRLPKPATYTATTVASGQRAVDKSSQNKTSGGAQERQGTTQAASNGPSSQSAHHRKTKSTVPDNNDKSGQRDQASINQNDQKSKLSQTQKVQQHISKSSGQQPRQQSISLTTSQVGKNAPTSATQKISDLKSIVGQQKSYFDQVSSLNNTVTSNGTSGKAPYMPSKQSSAENSSSVGIEGTNCSTAMVVNVNTGGPNATSSGIFQSLTSVTQRPIIQDLASQNLLKRLESGSSDNQLKQNYQSRQSHKDDPKGAAQLQGSRLSQASAPNGSQNHWTGQQKAPVTGYHTLDTVGDGTSSHEIKVPINMESDRGVSKSIFYGTQRVSNLANGVQKISNEQISFQGGAGQRKDLSKTQAINSSSDTNNYLKNHFNQQHLRTSHNSGNNERSTKHVARADSSSRHSQIQSKTQGPMKQPRHSSSVIQKRADTNGTLSGSEATEKGRSQRNHNGYAIPTQSQLPAQKGVGQTSGAQSSIVTNKNSQSKFQSVKVGSQVKVAPSHPMPKSTIEHQAQTISSKGHNPQVVQLANQNQQQNLTSLVTLSGPNPSKKKDAVQKTRSHSVSGSGATHSSSNVAGSFASHHSKAMSTMQTPAQHRKGSSHVHESGPSGHAAASLTAHYRASTASSQNKERRSSQPPSHHHHANHQRDNNTVQYVQGSSQLNSSLLFNSQPSSNAHPSSSQHPSKQRSASTSNQQSSLLVKSMDSTTVPAPGGHRGRQKSTRDSQHSSLMQGLVPNDRQFQSITHTTSRVAGPNSSMLIDQSGLNETVMNQSFTAGPTSSSAAVASRYSQALATTPGTSASAAYDKRKQQVANINELLSVAETLRQSNNLNVKARASESMKNSGTDVRPKLKNNFMTTSGASSQLTANGGGQGSKVQASKPIVISDLAINFAQFGQQPAPQQSVATIQSELQASLLLGQPAAQSLAQAQSKSRVSGKTQQQSLTAAMKQITDGLLQRQSHQQDQQARPVGGNASATSYQPLPASSSQYAGGPSQPPSQSHHQSYLSDLFAKQHQQQQSQQQQQSAARGASNSAHYGAQYKKSASGVGTSGQAGYSGTSQLLQLSQNGQTQQVNMKQSLYSPSGSSHNRAKSTAINQTTTLDATSDSARFGTSAYHQHHIQRTPYGKGSHLQTTLEAQGTPQSVLYSHQLQQTLNAATGGHGIPSYSQQQYSQHSIPGYGQAFYGNQGAPGKDYSTQQHPIAFLQQHQMNGGAHLGHSGYSNCNGTSGGGPAYNVATGLQSYHSQVQQQPGPHSYHHPQTALLMSHHQKHQQQQKPPSVPAPSTAYHHQAMLHQAQGAPPPSQLQPHSPTFQHEQQLNFYPNSAGQQQPEYSNE